jgi:putative serine protease PepD
MLRAMQIFKPLLPLAAAAAIGGGAGAVATTALHDDTPSVRTITNTRTVSSSAADTATSPHAVYESAKDSVAYITTGTGTGSGFVVSDDGYIVTNAHVVEGANGQIKAKIGDGKALDAKLVGEDASTDLALLKVSATNLKPLALGDSSGVEVGDPAYAIGNPFGLDRTLTTGVVSALQREISSPNGFSIDDVIQTDAAINPGNSGGPLLSRQGRVLGINAQIKSQSGGGEGVGFAIPIDTVRRSLRELRAKGHVDYAFLGVTTLLLYPQLAEKLGLPVRDGAVVSQVEKGSPADDAGLKAGDDKITFQGQQDVPKGGDVIVAVGGRKLSSTNDLADVVSALPAGREVSLEVVRGSDRRTVKVKLGKRPARPPAR